MPSTDPFTVAIRVDALARLGVGHLVRQLALAEEFLGRGRRVRLFGVTDVPWASEQIAARGLTLEAPDADPASFAARLVAEGVGTVVIDGYEFGPELGAELRASGIVVATVCDAEFGLAQEADLYVDQNLGAVARRDVHPDGQWLVGLDYVVLRDVVRDRRRSSVERGAAPHAGRLRVLVVFGGTDPFGGVRTVVPLLLGTGVPVEVVAIAARPEVADFLRGVPTGEGQSIEVHLLVDDLPGLAVTCDAAVSASGTSVWELACLGVPTALVCVTANQRIGYREATKELCLPAGELERLTPGGTDLELAAGTFRRLLSDADLRLALRERGRATVDGRGRERVADALDALERAKGP